MDNIIVMKLETEIEGLIDKLSNHEVGTSEHKSIMEAIDKLYVTLNKEKEIVLSGKKMEIEKEKIDNDYIAAEKQSKHSKWFNVAETLVKVGSVGGPLVLYAVYMNKGFKFEETGTYTSPTFKGLIGKFKPTK